MKKFSTAAVRNGDAIAEVLARIIPAPSTVLEVGSGTGQHAVFFAGKLPSITWLPSDSEEAEVESISAWRIEAALPNLRGPIRLDVRRADWELPPLDPPLSTILAIDLVSVSPWSVCVGLLNGAGELLPTGGRLIIYGSSLPRPVEEVERAAAGRGLTPIDRHELPGGSEIRVLRRE